MKNMFNDFYKSLIISVVFLCAFAAQAQFSISPTPSSGQIDLTSQSTQTINLVNSGSSNQVMNLSLAPITDNLNGFSLLTNRCLGKTLKKNQSCYFIISFNKASLSSGSRQVQLKNGSDNLVILSGSNNISLSPPSFSSSVMSLDFGTLRDYFRSSSPKSIVITNNGQQKGTPIIEVPNGISIVLNRCSNGVEGGKSCAVSFTFKNSQSIIPQSAQNYIGDILIKKSIDDMSPVAINILALLSNFCPSGNEFSHLLNSCVDVKPQLSDFASTMLPPTGVANQNAGFFNATTNGGMDISFFAKDPKGGSLTYVVESGDSLGTLSVVNHMPQSGNPVSYPTSISEYFSYPNVSFLTTNFPYFRLFKPYDVSAGLKHWYVKVTATSSASGFSNSIVFHGQYENDVKMPYGSLEISANNSQTNRKILSPTVSSNSGASSISSYRDIAYISPSQNSLSFKISIDDDLSPNAYGDPNSLKVLLIISEANTSTGIALQNSKLLAAYEYDYATQTFARKNTLNEPQYMNCNIHSSGDYVLCTWSKPNLANELHGKVIQVRSRIMDSSLFVSRAFFHNYLVLNNISGTSCAASADPVAAPFHGIKVVDLNNDGKIAHTDVFMQICTAEQLRSISYNALTSPIGLSRRFANYRLENDIDMAPYYSGGGYKFYIREIQSIFDGNNHKISNFIIDVNDSTKNNSGVVTNESTIGPNLPVGAGTYSGTGSQGQLGFIGRLIGAHISNLTLENIKVLGNGWTTVGPFGMSYSFSGVSPNGRLDIGTITLTDNSSAISYNMMKNVKVISSGVDGDNRPLSRIKGSSGIGGLTGSVTGDSLNNLITNSGYSLNKVVVDGVSLDTDNFFTQGAVTVGGIVGGSRKMQLSEASINNVSLKDLSGTSGVFFGGISGYDHYSTISNSYVYEMSGQSNSGLTVGGIAGVLEAIQVQSPLTYYPTKTNIFNVWAAFDFNSTLWNLNGASVNVGRLVGGMRNVDLSNSFAVGELNIASFLPSSTNFYAGLITSYIDINAPYSLSAVESEPSAGAPYQCGSVNTLCDAQLVTPPTYFDGYFWTMGPAGSPVTQGWDFSNIWRNPTMSESQEFQRLQHY